MQRPDRRFASPRRVRPLTDVAKIALPDLQSNRVGTLNGLAAGILQLSALSFWDQKVENATSSHFQLLNYSTPQPLIAVEPDALTVNIVPGRMKLFLIVGFILTLLSSSALAQTSEASPNDTDSVRVNVTINPDESRTTYQFDSAHHKATAITTERDGKPRGKIEYTIDQAGRFSSGRVFGSDGRFRFNSYYKYDAAGRLQEETQRRDDDSLLAKIVYSYDAAGKQTGYAIFDAGGKLISRVGGPSPSPSASAKSRKGGR